MFQKEQQQKVVKWRDFTHEKKCSCLPKGSYSQFIKPIQNQINGEKGETNVKVDFFLTTPLAPRIVVMSVSDATVNKRCSSPPHHNIKQKSNFFKDPMRSRQ
jgi:hypothetical protein